VEKLSWQKAIILNPNEQVLHSWDGNCERHHKAVAKAFIGHKTVESKETNSGTLVLTNQRLLWFERRGFLSKTERASFEINLGNLKGITCGGTINKWVSITDNEAENIFHLDKVGAKEIEPFRDMILRQVQSVKQAVTAAQSVPAQKEVITREVVMLPCGYCGGLMIQTSTFCPNCGAKRKS
jgi:rubrerythrin